MDVDSKVSTRPFYVEQTNALQQYPDVKFKVLYSPTPSTLSEDLRFDRFTLKIPYCGIFLQWDILYNNEQVMMPPDFIFEEKDEFFVSLDKVSSLKKWTPTNPNALLDIVLELLQFYKNYQKQQIINVYSSTKVQFELSSVSDLKGVDLLLKKKEGEIILQLPFPAEQKILQAREKEESRLTFSITMYPDNLSKTTQATLSWTPGSIWEALLAGTKLPPWTEDTCTITYIPLLHELIGAQFEALEVRRKAIEALQDAFGPSLEHDGYNFQRVAFAIDHSNLVFVCHFSLPDYPSKQPNIILVSHSQPSKNGKPKQTTFSSYPYSPRWSPEEYAKRMRVWMIENANEFKKLCLDDIAWET